MTVCCNPLMSYSPCDCYTDAIRMLRMRLDAKLLVRWDVTIYEPGEVVSVAQVEFLRLIGPTEGLTFRRP